MVYVNYCNLSGDRKSWVLCICPEREKFLTFLTNHSCQTKTKDDNATRPSRLGYRAMRGNTSCKLFRNVPVLTGAVPHNFILLSSVKFRCNLSTHVLACVVFHPSLPLSLSFLPPFVLPCFPSFLPSIPPFLPPFLLPFFPSFLHSCLPSSLPSSSYSSLFSITS